MSKERIQNKESGFYSDEFAELIKTKEGTYTPAEVDSPLMMELYEDLEDGYEYFHSDGYYQRIGQKIPVERVAIQIEERPENAEKILELRIFGKDIKRTIIECKYLEPNDEDRPYYLFFKLHTFHPGINYDYVSEGYKPDSTEESFKHYLSFVKDAIDTGILVKEQDKQK